MVYLNISIYTCTILVLQDIKKKIYILQDINKKNLCLTICQKKLEALSDNYKGEEKAKSLTLSNILFLLYIINFQLRIVEMLWRRRKIYFFLNKECKLFGTPVKVPIDLLTPPFEHLKTQSLKFEFVFNKFFFIDQFMFVEELAARIIETPNANVNPWIVVGQGFIDNYFEGGM